MPCLSVSSCASTHDDSHTASSSRTRAIPLASHTDESRDRTGIERRRGGKSARSHHSPRRMVLHLSSMAGLAGRPCSLCICASFGRLMERKEKNHQQRSTHAHLLTAPCRSHAHTRRWLSACARRASPTGTYWRPGRRQRRMAAMHAWTSIQSWYCRRDLTLLPRPEP